MKCPKTETDIKQVGQSSARDLIYHESLNHLIHEVQELRTRCGNLEAANVQLESTVQTLQQTIRITQAPTTNGHLVGYASSDTSCNGESSVSKAFSSRTLD